MVGMSSRVAKRISNAMLLLFGLNRFALLYPLVLAIADIGAIRFRTFWLRVLLRLGEYP